MLVPVVEGKRLSQQGRHVIVTGGRRGIGEAVAASIAKSGGTAWAHAADVSDPEQVRTTVDAAAQRWDGRIDVLVNNAGIDHDQAFLDFEHDRWQAVIGVNLTGPFLMSQAVGRVMAQSGGGAIVHISSIDALGADGTQVAYNASKAGLLGLNRTMAMELAPHGIRSNVVNPGYTATPLTRQYVGEKMYEYMTTSFARVPQGRMATPEEIAAAVVFLASDDAAAITGTDLTVDGGTTANLFIVETIPEG